MQILVQFSIVQLLKTQFHHYIYFSLGYVNIPNDSQNSKMKHNYIYYIFMQTHALNADNAHELLPSTKSYY